MSRKIEISFARSAKPSGAVAVFPVAEGLQFPAAAQGLDPGGTLEKAAGIASFKGKSSTNLDILAPSGSSADRFLLVGTGKASAHGPDFWIKLGGTICSAVHRARKVVVYLDGSDPAATGADAADLALGMLLRGYGFDRYKTRKGDADEAGDDERQKVTIVTSTAAAAKKAFEAGAAVAAGVNLARDLVNEPANHLGPIEFAARVKDLEKLGVKVEILTEREMRKLGMGALLGVAQGSVRPPRLGIMRWNGGKAKDKPVAFIGKGVVFDTGGISMKPAAGMEDMKGDMGGAAAVTGLMHVLAARKAALNAIGVVGLVENMPDGNAQRPGDIVTSMSGQTIEVLNTDAEGRLVLADALWYCAERFQPRFMVDLATLTGAIMVALGKYHAGLFSNDDALADNLAAAGLATGERVWRMPLGSEYDKLIDSRIADMKNIGGRYGGAIIAAQFLQRFVKDTPWAHLDIAGTALGSPASEINDSWGSGFGVRLLDRLVRDHYEG
ncbi:MAG: leucyl aminopeptidase [Rhizobiaceae bacterium]|nr:MAG: leucyl aminopeptidase [Rhizobiaceae bacterium]